MEGKKIFVGIGAGAVQLGLWAYYAGIRGAEVVLVEVDEEKIRNIRRNKNSYCLNIAHFDRIVRDAYEIIREWRKSGEKSLSKYRSVGNL